MIGVLLCLLAGGAQVPVLHVPNAALDDDGVTTPTPRLIWPTGTSVRVEDGDGELVVRFDRALPADRIAAFRDAAGDAIGTLRWNDDSLVLRAADGWRMSWRQTASVLAVTFAPPPGSVAAVPAEDAARDAALVGIEADAAAGYPGRARRAAVALARRYPEDRRVARIAADAALADGDIGSAAERYRALAADDRIARRALAAAPGTAAIGVTARDGSDMSQAEFAARIDPAIGDHLGAGGGIRYIASRVATQGGRVRSAATVADASLAILPAHAVRLQLLASAALDDAVTGGGARVVIGSAEAQVRATLTRHMPDYSTPAQVLAGGYLSRAVVGVTYRLTPGLVAQADIGANRYGLGGEAGASDTITVSGGVDYLIRRQFPALGLSYRFEAEYLERMRLAAGGAAIVPLATRENHTLQAFVSGATGEVQMTALAGWTVDRFGGDGPTASVGVAAPIGIAWRIEGSGGITSIARPGFSGRQLFARAQLIHALGDGR